MLSLPIPESTINSTCLSVKSDFLILLPLKNLNNLRPNFLLFHKCGPSTPEGQFIRPIRPSQQLGLYAPRSSTPTQTIRASSCPSSLDEVFLRNFNPGPNLSLNF